MTDGVTTDIHVDDILQQIISSTKNDVIIFMIVIFVILLVIGIPIFRMMMKRKNTEDENELNEKRMLMEVIKDNTSAITSLKITLDLNNTAMLDALQKIEKSTSSTNADMSTVISNQEITLEKIDRALNIYSNMGDHIKQSNMQLSMLSDIKDHNIKSGVKIDTLVDNSNTTKQYVIDSANVSKDILRKLNT